MKNCRFLGRVGFAVGLFAAPFGRCCAPASRQLLSLTLCLLLSLSLSSQDTFIKRFNIESVNTLSHNLKVVGDSLVLLGAMSDTLLGGVKAFYSKFDLSGTLSYHKTYHPDRKSVV